MVLRQISPLFAQTRRNQAQCTPEMLLGVSVRTGQTGNREKKYKICEPSGYKAEALEDVSLKPVRCLPLPDATLGV